VCVPPSPVPFPSFSPVPPNPRPTATPL
jgi:hypothetical protein